MQFEAFYLMQTPHQCSGCLSRRHCLQIITTAAAGLAFSGEFFPALAKSRKADPDFVDPTQAAPPSQGPRWTRPSCSSPGPIGWAGPAPLTSSTSARRNTARCWPAPASASAIELHEEDKPIEDEAAMTAFLKAVRERKPDGVLVILQHMNCWGWVNRLANEAGVPLIVFSPIGTSFTGHVAGISRQPGVYVVSSLEWPAVEDGLRMVRAKRMFEETRVLWIQGNERNETVLDRLGTKVRAIPRNTFNELFDKMPVNEEVKDVASTFRKHAKRVVEPTWQDSLNSARVYTTAKRLLTDEQANALSMDCLGMVSAKLVPHPARAAPGPCSRTWASPAAAKPTCSAPPRSC